MELRPNSNPRRSPIGRRAMVRDLKHDRQIVEATVIDAVANERKAKRVRLQTGEYAGEVRMLADYELLEFLD